MRKLFAAVSCLLLCLCLGAGASEGAVEYRNISVSPDGSYVDFDKTRIADLKRFYRFLDERPELKKVDLYATPLSLKNMEALMVQYPRIEFGCTFRFVKGTLSTNAQAYSTWNHISDPMYPSARFAALKYCDSLKALDLGHNHIRELDFIAHLSDLRILILSVCDIDDLSVIGSFEQLEYLELFNNEIMDLSPLKNLRKLKHLNLCHNPFSDISPLLEMKQLKRLWLSDRFLTTEQKQMLEDALPGCEIWYAWGDCTGNGWRSKGGYYPAMMKVFKSGVYAPLPD